MVMSKIHCEFDTRSIHRMIKWPVVDHFNHPFRLQIHYQSAFSTHDQWVPFESTNMRILSTNTWDNQYRGGYPRDTHVLFGHLNILRQQFLRDKQQLVILKALIRHQSTCVVIPTIWNIWMGCICVLHRLDSICPSWIIKPKNGRSDSKVMLDPDPHLSCVRFLFVLRFSSCRTRLSKTTLLDLSELGIQQLYKGACRDEKCKCVWLVNKFLAQQTERSQDSTDVAPDWALAKTALWAMAHPWRGSQKASTNHHGDTPPMPSYQSQMTAMLKANAYLCEKSSAFAATW